ncbi:hypothetical protein DFH06DRAFT_458961 [Mycena polygramma]|nr:hypothetical protein DFH06DRAFT_458961 [Mycena polygramma]
MDIMLLAILGAIRFMRPLGYTRALRVGRSAGWVISLANRILRGSSMVKEAEGLDFCMILRDSTSIRASVYDVFLELGALDANSRVAEWFFTDPSYVLPDPDEGTSHSHRDTVKFVDGSMHRQAFHAEAAEIAPKMIASSMPLPPTCIKSYILNFSPKLIRCRASKTKSSARSSDTHSVGPPCDGCEKDGTLISALRAVKEARVCTAVSLPPGGRSNPVFAETPTTPVFAETPNEIPPSLPTSRERSRLTRTGSSSSLAKAKSLFCRKRSKGSPQRRTSTDTESDDALTQWHEVSALIPRIYNPSAINGAPLISPPSTPRGGRRVPSSCRDIQPTPSERTSGIAPPQSFFSPLSLKRRVAPPRALHLAESSRRLSADSARPWGPDTPTVFVVPIDNPTPHAALRRFSDVTSMTVYPMSAPRTPSSMAFPSSVVFPSWDEEPTVRRRSHGYARSESSLHDALALAGAASPYDLYRQPARRVQRGREPAFPSSPMLSEPLSGELSREATIRRYREFSDTLAWW